MSRIVSIWRGMSRAQRAVAVLAALAVAAVAGFAAAAFVQRPGDVSNPDAAFHKREGAGKERKPPRDRSVDWPRFGYDVGRSKFLDAQHIRPPFRKLWKYDGGELIEFPPIVVDDRLYLIDNDGLHVALDAETGRVIWKKRLSRLNASSPAYDGGVLYSVSLEPGQAVAVRARDGKVLWRKDLGVRAESSPLVVRGRLYFGDEAGALRALRARDGKAIWETGLGGAVKAAPALHDGTLYVGDYGGNMNAVRASDGKLLWQTPDLGVGLGQSGRIYSTAAVAFGRVYAGDVDGRVYSYDAETGEIAWSFSAGDYVYSGVAAADTNGTPPTVLFGSHDRNVYAVDAQSGKELWRASAGGQISGPATVVGDVVYVSTFSGDATIGLDLGTGRRVFSFDEGEYGPVVSDAEKLYLTGGTTVVAFAPIDVDNFRFKEKKGQKGIVPPKERRRIEARMRNGGGAARPRGEHPNKPTRAGGEPGRKPAGDGGGGRKRAGGGRKRG